MEAHPGCSSYLPKYKRGRRMVLISQGLIGKAKAFGFDLHEHTQLKPVCPHMNVGRVEKQRRNRHFPRKGSVTRQFRNSALKNHGLQTEFVSTTGNISFDCYFSFP